MVKKNFWQTRLWRLFSILMVGMLALTWTGSLSAHNLQTQMVSMVFDSATLDFLDARIAGGWVPGTPLLQTGDELGLVIKVIPRQDGTTTGVGGYVDFYVPNGVTVLDAGYVVPDGSGDYDLIPMKGQSLIAIGAGPIGAKSTPALSGLTLGPNINGVTTDAVVSGSGLHRGTVAGVYGDTGIFYATDPQTVYGSYSGGTLTNNSGDVIVPLNKWDAEQLAAFGIKGSTNPSYPSTPIIDFGDGRGNTPWGMGSGVAGPESGYAWQFDKDVYDATGNMRSASSFVGPWKRIQYPGSRVSFDQPGLASSNLGIASVDAGALGFNLNPANPLPATVSQSDDSSPKTIRWSVGQLTRNFPEYVWVQIRVDTPSSAIVDPSGCPIFNAGTFGGDAGGDSNGKDHLWRYYEPSTVEWNGCLGLGKPSGKVVVGTGEIFQYPIKFYNLGNFTLNNIIVEDTLPSNVSYLSAVPAPVSGPNPLRWVVPTLQPGQKFEALVTVKSTGSGAIDNRVCVQSDEIDTCASDITITGPFPYLVQDKTANVSNVNPAGNVVYTITMKNIGNGPSASPVVIQEYLPLGFSYVSLGAVTVNGAAIASTTVNSSDANKPVFTVPAAINGGNELVLKFTAKAASIEGTYCNSFTSLQNNIPLTTGSLACVTIGGGKIGDTIFRDWSGNGVQEPVDEGIAGVTVELRDCGVNGTCGDGDDGPTRTTTTDELGFFLFEGLTQSNYEVVITDTGNLLNGYTQSADPDGACLPAPGPNCDDQSALFLPDGAQRLDQDFGYKPGGTGSIGDTVWNDNGSGGGVIGDGIQNGTEPGIDGVTVFLFEDTNGNGLVDTGDALVGTTTTAGGGVYNFGGLAEGLDYIVRVSNTDPVVVSAVCGGGSCPIGNSTPSSQHVANLAGVYTEADFGFYEPPPASISGKAFQDENADGVFNAGDVNLPNVTVRLFEDSNGNGVLDPGEPEVAVTTTGGGGNYSFTDLGPGNYIVDIAQDDPDIPDGYSPTVDEIAVELPEGTDVTGIDFPFVRALAKSVENLSQATPNNGASAVATDTLEYTLRPFYAGSQLLSNVTVTDMIPVGTTYVPASANLGGGFSFNVTADPSKDTYIYENQPLNNFGISTILFLRGKADDPSRALLQFELPSIPPGATIASATLTLQKTAGDDGALNVAAHGLTRAWNEGDKDGAACTADSGGANWNTYNCVNNWSTAGGDFVPTASATTSVAGEGIYNWNLTSLVQQWYAGTLTNNGLLLKYAAENTDKSISFASLNNETVGVTLPTLAISYTTAELTWSLGSSQPGRPGRDLSGLNIYGFRGDDKTDFWKYNLSADSWASSVSAPGTVKEGGALTTDGNHIYALRGDGSTAFWRIDPDADVSWTPLPATPAAVKAGGALTTDGTYIYALQGNDQTAFWRYAIAAAPAGSWAPMTSTPASIKEGGALTTDGTYIYALRGTGTKTIWRYPIASGTGGAWEPLPNLPQNVKIGGAMTFDGSYLYVLRGDGKKDFWRYPVAAGTGGGWVTLAPAPENIRDGGALTFDGQDIYAFRGDGKTNFWRYDINGNAWDTSLDPTLQNVRWGGALVSFGTLGDTIVSLQAFPGLVSCDPANDCPIEINVVMTVENAGAVTVPNVQAPATLSICDGGACPGGVTASKVSGPSPAGTADLNPGATLEYTYVYEVTAGSGIGSATFSGAPAGFVTGRSNSVIVTPPLTFQVTVDGPPATVTQVTNTGVIQDAAVIPPTNSNEVMTQLPAGEIGDFHFYDNNGNGIYEPGAGETGVPNATVVLVEDTNGNGAADAGELAVATTTTADGTGSDPIGYYNFTNVPPGNYVVQAASQTVESPANPGVFGTMVATTGEELGATVVCTTTCTKVTDADFGFIEGALIEGYVFHDVDNNGVRGAGETGLTPVSVTITPPANVDLGAGDGNPVTVLTEPDGSYSFLVPPGEYTLTYNQDEAAQELLNDGTATTLDVDKTTATSLIVSVIAGQESKNNNFGIDHSGAIGDTIFNDANGDGIRAGAGEPGIPGVTVQLWADAGNDGTPDTLLAFQATDEFGNYLFEGLDQGNYLVIVLTSTLPSGFVQTADPDQDGVICTICDSKGNADITSDGQQILDVDFGYKPPAGTYPISGRIWDDQDGSGGQNGAEPGLEDVTVCLYESDGQTLIVCTTTDSNGDYVFPGNPNGSYVVKVDPTTLPPAAVQTGDPDSSCPSAGCDDGTPVTVSGGPETGNNFGYQEVVGSITGTICQGGDDGFCLGETPVTEIVNVTLVFAGPDGILGTPDDVTLFETTSGGNYSFTNLPPGLYQVTYNEVDLPGTFAPHKDADGNNPNNITVILGSGQNQATRDFEVAVPTAVSIITLGLAGGDKQTLVLAMVAVISILLLTLHLSNRRRIA